ncbi:MAG: MBL fold metallo-hydrolase [Pseudonocardiaceae bacterium]
MSQILTAPTHHETPTEVAPGTYVIHEVQHALGAPFSVYLNSMVIKAREPVLVDTGSARNRTAWLEDTFALVDPHDVGWIFISHEDPDHVGNLAEAMQLCPNATLVCSWAIVERFTSGFEFPLHRCRWANDGTSFEVGDRTLAVVRPPVYDSPTTRGLLDTSTGVYWAADTFATPIPGGTDATELAIDVADLDHEFWQHGMSMYALNALSPWLQLIDPTRFATEVTNVQNLDMTTIVSGHSPTINADQIPTAWDHLRALAGRHAPPIPDQAVLEVILAATMQVPTAGK